MKNKLNVRWQAIEANVIGIGAERIINLKIK